MLHNKNTGRWKVEGGQGKKPLLNKVFLDHLPSTTFAVMMFCLAASSHAAMITAASCSQSAVQAAINQAQTGDTVSVPAGTCAWTTVAGSYTPAVSVTKAITLQGAGIDQTTIVDSSSIDETPLSIGSGVRVTGFTFTGMKRLPARGVSEPAMNVGGSNWRVDHNKFYPNPPSGQDAGRGMSADGTGVIDHNQFIDCKQGIEIWGSGDASWNAPQTLGTGNAVYIEDNTFNYSEALDGAYDAYTGARYVFRHNTVIGTNIGNHGLDSGGLRSPHSFEVYDNTFNNPGTHVFITMYFRGGSGVIFNNSVTANGGSYDGFANLTNYRSCDDYSSSWGVCNGSNPIDGNTPGGQGYPCMDQVGRTTGQTLSPVYSWNNTYKGGTGNLGVAQPFSQCSRMPTYHIVANRDYYNNTPKPGYTPYVYPHPLVSGAPPPPPPPPSGNSCDVNADGSTNVSDVQMCVNQAIGVAACTADINQDGSCNVIDVQRVVNNALGGQCVTQ